MTLEQILNIRERILPAFDAVPSGRPSLQHGAWLVGFRKKTASMTLQVELRNCKISNEADLYRAEIDLESRIRDAFLMSTQYTAFWRHVKDLTAALWKSRK
jgi:hypothetical protein